MCVSHGHTNTHTHTHTRDNGVNYCRRANNHKTLTGGTAISAEIISFHGKDLALLGLIANRLQTKAHAHKQRGGGLD